MHYAAETLDVWFAGDPEVFVAANMFVYYARGDRLKHVSPDVFVVKGIPKTRTPDRRRYLVWEEGKAPDFVLELTSESTREEDVDDKMDIYRDVLGVREYFLFDPYSEFLKPRLQGHRLVAGRYEPIAAVDGRLPSEVLGLHLEAVGELVRLYNPSTGQWLPIPPEDRQARQEAEARAEQAEEKVQQAEEKVEEVTSKMHEADAEIERLRRELEDLRRKLPPEELPPASS